MSDVTVLSSTQRIIVDPFSSSVVVVNAGPIGNQGDTGPIGNPGTESSTYVTSAAVSQFATESGQRLTTLEDTPTYHAFSFQNGFQAFPGWPTPRYWKKHGIVYFEGLLQRSGPVSPLFMFTLPVGFRPAYDHVIACAGDGVMNRIDIHTNGTVLFHIGTTTFISLYGIQFGV